MLLRLEGIGSGGEALYIRARGQNLRQRSPR